MKKKYLVTGGTGFIGRGLVRGLLGKGYGVRILDNQYRSSLNSLNDLKNEIEFIEGDIRNPDVLNKASKDIDGVWHLAFINGTSNFYEKPQLVLDVGVRGMLNVIDACKNNNIRELFLASSSEVYQTPNHIPTSEKVSLSIPDPLNPRYSYGGGKLISELLCLNYGREFFERVVIFRPHNVYGPNMGFEHVIPQFILRMQKLIKINDKNIIDFKIQGNGAETRAFCFIDDFIEGLMVLEEYGSHLNIYHIGTEDEISIRSIAEKISNYFEKKIKVEPGKLAEGGTLRRCPDISKIMNLGYRPKVELKDGIAKTADWYLSNIK